MAPQTKIGHKITMSIGRKTNTSIGVINALEVGNAYGHISGLADMGVDSGTLNLWGSDILFLVEPWYEPIEEQTASPTS